MENFKEIIKDIRESHENDIFQQDGHIDFVSKEFEDKIGTYEAYIRAVDKFDSDDYANASFNLGYEYALREVERRLNAS